MQTRSTPFKNGTTITWDFVLDGGGSTQYVDFLEYLGLLGRRYESGLEWCSGLGAIGFSILDAGVCKNMSFMDLYGPAEECTLNNAKDNSLSDRVKFFNLDMIQKLPLDAKFDLVVANPPHCLQVPKGVAENGPHAIRLILDSDWNIHREFFNNIVAHLNNDADVILSEIFNDNYLIQMGVSAGLTYVESYTASELSKNSNTPAVLMHFKFTQGEK